MAYSDTTKIHGEVVQGESMGKQIDFFEIVTSIALEMGVQIDPTTPTGADNIAVLDAFIASRGQAIMRSVSENAGEYTYKFAIEHADSWTVATTEANDLEVALNGLKLPTGESIDMTPSTGNTTVSKSASL